MQNLKKKQIMFVSYNGHMAHILVGAPTNIMVTWNPWVLAVAATWLLCSS
jgi:hypothetical protein